MKTVLKLTPQLLIEAYSAGVFPMAQSRHGPIEWHSPDPRAILPLDKQAFHIPRSLAKRIRSERFQISIDSAFERVIQACAEPRPKHPETWINHQIIDAYCQLHQQGQAHSIEAWQDCVDSGKAQPELQRKSPKLVGGLYGVALGGVFFGESMFTRVTDASKICLVKLVEHLQDRGFSLLDVQFANPHLDQFGLIELPRHEYQQRLRAGLATDTHWSA